jgi:hypothetical protein
VKIPTYIKLYILTTNGIAFGAIISILLDTYKYDPIWVKIFGTISAASFMIIGTVVIYKILKDKNSQ